MMDGYEIKWWMAQTGNHTYPVVRVGRVIQMGDDTVYRTLFYMSSQKMHATEEKHVVREIKRLTKPTAIVRGALKALIEMYPTRFEESVSA